MDFNNPQPLIALVQAAFTAEYPGDAFLQNSYEGLEPFDEVQPFKGRDWRGLDGAFLDAHYDALSFFSEGALRYFLPAYLIADLQGELQTVDLLFHLTHGFYEIAIRHPVGERSFVRRSGRHAFINPRRYGAITWFDYARHRLAVFTREEAQAIVLYLRYRRAGDEGGLYTPAIDAALELFWLARAEQAPTAAELRAYQQAEDAYTAALIEEMDKESPEDGE